MLTPARLRLIASIAQTALALLLLAGCHQPGQAYRQFVDAAEIFANETVGLWAEQQLEAGAAGEASETFLNELRQFRLTTAAARRELDSRAGP